MAELLPVGVALARLLEGEVALPVEEVDIADAAWRVLSGEIVSRRTQPPFPASAMDGYAVRADDIATLPATLRVIGESVAGLRFDGSISAGETVRIFTRAPVPEGADTILLQDETLSPGVPEAIAEVRDAGYDVMLATGRSWSGTRRYVEVLDLTAEFTVCSNGAVIMRRVGDEWVRWHVEVFDPAPVLALLRDRLPEARYMVELESGQRLYTAVLDDWTLDGGRQVDFDELVSQPVSRVVVVSPEHDEDDFHQLVAEVGLKARAPLAAIGALVPEGW